MQGGVIAEGKTKIVRSVPNTTYVLIESKDDITAGDGAKRDVIKGKGIYCTEITANCFRLLNRAGVPTHFIGQVNERTFKAACVQMIPIELVARRIATGSYIKRNPSIQEGTLFAELVIEFFLKDDARHDPLMCWDENKQCFELYDAHKPNTQGYLEDLPFGALFPASCEEIQRMQDILRKVFLILERAWALQDVALVDLKLECGYTEEGILVVADIIDNDSWRIWPASNRGQMKDKQVYRDMSKATADELDEIRKNSAWVAEATALFLL